MKVANFYFSVIGYCSNVVSYGFSNKLCPIIRDVKQSESHFDAITGNRRFLVIYVDAILLRNFFLRKPGAGGLRSNDLFLLQAMPLGAKRLPITSRLF